MYNQYQARQILLVEYAKLSDKYPILKDIELKWGTGLQTLGTCKYPKWILDLDQEERLTDSNTLSITVSTHPLVVEQAGIKQLKDTLRHEVAHALAILYDANASHDAGWRAWCLKVGAEPERCHNIQIKKPSQYTMICSNTGKELKQVRRITDYVKLHLDLQKKGSGIYTCNCCNKFVKIVK